MVRSVPFEQTARRTFLPFEVRGLDPQESEELVRMLDRDARGWPGFTTAQPDLSFSSIYLVSFS